MEDLLELRYALDTFYFLVSGALVMWMAAGFTMLESGLVRAKNTTEILTKNVGLYSIACIMYMACGYGIMYGDGTGPRPKISAARDSSTIGAIGLPPGGGLGTEDTPVSLEQMAGHYKRSKYLAEQEVHKLAKEGLPVVIVNPSAPVGEGDVKPTPTGQVIVDFMKGRMPAYIETGMNIIDVDDVATGHLLAMEKGEENENALALNPTYGTEADAWNRLLSDRADFRKQAVMEKTREALVGRGGGVTQALQMAGATLLITSLEGWLISPALMGKAERMNAVAVFLGLLLWTWVWGAWGTVLAVPMLVIIKSVADHIPRLKPVGRLMAR